MGSDGLQIAYQVVGDSPVDVVYVPGLANHIESMWDIPELARFTEPLASFCRLILIDKRGTGLSDRLPSDSRSSVEGRMHDVRAEIGPRWRPLPQLLAKRMGELRLMKDEGGMDVSSAIGGNGCSQVRDYQSNHDHDQDWDDGQGGTRTNVQLVGERSPEGSAECKADWDAECQADGGGGGGLPGHAGRELTAREADRLHQGEVAASTAYRCSEGCP